jgi:hypothetical protein
MTNIKKWVIDWKNHLFFIKWFFCLAQEEKQVKTEEYAKLIDEIRERNRQREQEATFTEIWYTFVDPYATDVDERGTGISNRRRNIHEVFDVCLDDAHKAVGILIIKNGKRIIGMKKWFENEEEFGQF